VWLLSVDDMVVVGPDEVYFCGSSGAAPGGKVGVGHYSSGTFVIEDEGSGLTKFDPEISNNQRFTGIAWDHNDSNEVWIVDTGAGSVVGSKIYRGKIGGPWTLAIRLDASYGYTSRYLCSQGNRSIVMDKDGILYLSANDDGVDPDVVVAGDPRLAQPSLVQVANPATSNVGLGDNWTANGYVLMADNGKSMFYIPGTGWTVPAIDAGNYYGQALAGFPEPEYVIEETATAVDTVTVVSTSIPPSDDERILMANDLWIKPDQDPPKPDPDRAAYYGGGTSAIAWDSRRRRVVLLTEPTTLGILQAWDYIPDSNAWTERAPFGGMEDVHYPTSLSKDVGLTACFDGVTDKVLIYALSKTTGTPTLWHWDASRITKLAPVGMPTVEEPQLVWDEGRQSCWLYGYSASSGQPYELFEFYPAIMTFVDRYVVHPPGNYPAGRRRGAGFAYDPQLGEIILTHGGIAPTLYSDTWSFKDGIWTNRTPSGTEGVDYPEKRTRTALVTAPDAELYLVGGYNASSVQIRDTWKWQGSLGTWTDVPPNTVMQADVNANMRAIGRWPPRIVVPTQPRVGVDVEIGQVNEAVTSVDGITLVDQPLGWDYLRTTNLPSSYVPGSVSGNWIFDSVGTWTTDHSGNGVGLTDITGNLTFSAPSHSFTGAYFAPTKVRSTVEDAGLAHLVGNMLTAEIQIRTTDTGSLNRLWSLDRYSPETEPPNGQWTFSTDGAGGSLAIQWEYHSGQNTGYTWGSAGANDGNIHHVVFTREANGTTVHCWLDKVYLGSGTTAHEPTGGTDVWMWFGSINFWAPNFTGWIYSARMLMGINYDQTDVDEAYDNLRI
jgi:hypothetical protein